MKIQKSRLITGNDPSDMAAKFGEVMAELASYNPTFDKIDDCTMLIRYEEEIENAAKVVPMKPRCTAPSCKDCINYRSNDGMVRAEHVAWGKCAYMLDAAVNGDKPICRFGEMVREEVRVGKSEHESKTSHVG